MSRKDLETDRHLGARVRFARLEKRISQGALGQQIGISFQQVQKYELGKDRISASQLLKIAGVLEKDVSFFYEDARSSGISEPGPVLADIVDRRNRPRASAAYDVKIIRILSAVEDDAVKAKVFGLLQAIVAAQHTTEQSDQQPLAA